MISINFAIIFYMMFNSERGQNLCTLNMSLDLGKSAILLIFNSFEMQAGLINFNIKLSMSRSISSHNSW